MDVLKEAVVIVIGIALLILLIKFVMFLFRNFIISRVLSVGCAIASFVMAFTVTDTAGTVPETLIIADTVVTVLAWLFFIGPVVFDVVWDGSFDITAGFTGYRATPHMVGGFFAHLAVSAVVVGIAYFLLGSDLPALYFLLPIGILLGNAYVILKAFR